METADTPLWLQDQSLRKLRARLAARPAGIRVVSFDFFDTLVCRLCGKPSDLFIEVGRRLAAANLLKRPLCPEAFHDARVAADERARRLAVARGRSPEITLAAIYDELRGVVTDADAARRLEFQTERDFCFLNPSVASLVQHVRSLGLKVALISDTYFTSAELGRLLRDNGFAPDLFDHLFVSNELGCAKWEGRLFLHACRHFGIHPNELLHIGDNIHADVQVARKLGVQAVHYPNPTPRQTDTFIRESLLCAPARRHGASVNALRMLTAHLAQDEHDAFRDGAFVFGPVLALYADWCVRRFQAAGVKTVLALMREGELLGELVDRAARAASVELRIQPCFASRLSTARASLSAITPDTVAELLEGSPTLTLQNVLEILGVLEEARSCITNEALCKPVPSVLTMRPLLERLFGQERLVELIRRRCKEAHALAFEYLDALTGGDANIGFLDLGWSGSIQRNILRILRNGGRQVRAIGCYVAATSRSGRLLLDGDEIHAYLDSNWQHCMILPEVAINASVGSTKGYARGPDGSVVPVLGEYTASVAERQLKQRIREGVLAFQTFWLALRAAKGEAAMTPAMRADLDQQAAAMLIRLIEHPDPGEARRLGNLTHDENYWDRQYSRPLCDEESERRLAARGVSGCFADLQCYWPQGVVARRHPRLVAALNKQWADPLALGRAGCTRDTTDHPTPLTEEERAALIELLRHFQPQTVVFAGGDTLALENDLAALLPNAGAASNAARGPALISFCHTPGTAAWHQRIEGEITAPATLRAARRALPPAARHALVLTGELGATAGKVVLNALAPFLGSAGVIFARCGDSDLVDAAHEHPLTRVLAEWLRSSGVALGYGMWQLGGEFAAERRNWMVLTRDRLPVESAHYWQLTLADLPLDARLGGKLRPAVVTPGNSSGVTLRSDGRPDKELTVLETR